MHLSYAVALDHDRYPWPAGLEEIAFHTDDGLAITGYALLLAPADPMQGAIDVQFVLPKDWQAQTPWQPTGEHRSSVPTRRELLNNILFLGTAPAETLNVGGVELTFVLGRRNRASRQLLVELLEKQLANYEQLFGGKPLASRYLILVHEGVDDGGAFAGSFSQFITGDADLGSRLSWGNIMAHELLHFWNGQSLVRTDTRDEWFNEGVTDYLTTATQAQTGVIDERQLFWRLENFARRYLIARYAQNLSMTVREAGADTLRTRELIHGGGALTGFALDVELRQATRGRVGLPQLMQSLSKEFARPGRTLALEDIARHARQLTGKDVGPFLQHAVESREFSDIKPTFDAVGLKLGTFFYDEAHVRRTPHATDEQRQRYAAIFAPR